MQIIAPVFIKSQRSIANLLVIVLGILLQNTAIASSSVQCIEYSIAYLNELNRDFVYKSDEEIWGVKDYWATTSEYYENKAGDCEEFALILYSKLQAKGCNEYLKFQYWAPINVGEQGHLNLKVEVQPNQYYILEHKHKEPIEFAQYKNSVKEKLSEDFEFFNYGIRAKGSTRVIKAVPQKFKDWLNKEAASVRKN